MKRSLRLVTLLSAVCMMSGTVSARAQDGHSATDQRTFTLQRSAVSPSAAAQATEPVLVQTRISAPWWARRPILLNFDALPAAPWELNPCGDPGSTSTVTHGIMTIESPVDCHEYELFHPHGVWHQYVSNRRGWIIEAGLKVDPGTNPECDDRGSLLIWAHDHTTLTIVGFSTNEICLAYPDQVRAPMDTSDFHIYRIEALRGRVKIYADGDLKIDHVLSWNGAGSDVLTFGDGSENNSLSQWDYFTYDVFPNFRPADWR